jgi:energy-coupling factor transporter ATP-binding protein EcfA2
VTKADLSVSNLGFRYRKAPHQLFNGLSFSLSSGELLVVTGGIGSGKTTLANILIGLYPHYIKGELSGEVYINGDDARDMPTANRLSSLGLFLSSPSNAFFTDRVQDEIVFNASWMGMVREEIVSRSESLIDLFGLSPLLSKNPHEISIGEQRIVLFTSLAVVDPHVYILDEPYSSIDKRNLCIIRNFILRKLTEGHSVLSIEHTGRNLFNGTRTIELRQGS